MLLRNVRIKASNINIVTVIFMLFIASESGSYKERKKEKINNTLIGNIL